MVDEAKTLSFSVISTQPSIQPCIDELLRSLQKRQMYKGSSEGSRNNIFLIASIIIMTVATTPRVSARTEDNQDWTQWKPNHSNPEVLLQTTTRMAGNELCTYHVMKLSLKAYDAVKVKPLYPMGKLINVSSQILSELSTQESFINHTSWT